MDSRSRSDDHKPLKPVGLLDLPTEVMLVIFSICEYRDLEALRRVSRGFHLTLPNAEIERIVSGDLRQQMLATCNSCLAHSRPINFVQLRASGATYPVSHCYCCYAKVAGFSIRQHVLLGDDFVARVCCWCGYPVANSTTSLHLGNCQREYVDAQEQHYKLGCIEASCATFILATSLGTHALKGCSLYRVLSIFEKECMPPSASILTLVVAGLTCKVISTVLVVKSHRPYRTFYIAFALDIARFLCYFVTAKRVLLHSCQNEMIVGGPFMLLFSFANLGFAAFSVVRDILLMCEYPFWTFARQDLDSERRVVHEWLTFMCLRANQWCQTQRYPPRYGWRQAFGIRESVMDAWSTIKEKLQHFARGAPSA